MTTTVAVQWSHSPGHANHRGSSPFQGKWPSHSTSKIDLVKAYHQILSAKADVPKTATVTPFSLF